MCSSVRVLRPSQQPSNQLTASCCCGPEVSCGLKSTCSTKRGNLLVERLASDGRTDLSFSEVLDRTDLSLDGLVCSLDAVVGVAVTDWPLFVHDFSWDVRVGFVFDVDDARFLVALWYHLLMTR